MSRPVRLPISANLQRLVPGPRVWKTALAVGLAWFLGSAVLGEERPVFAAMGAFLAMEPTIIRSVRRTTLQLVGVAGGAVLAFAGVIVVGIGPVLLALAVLFGLTLGRVVRSDRIGTELSVTALLVVGLADGSLAFGWLRLWETALGGLVAIVINIAIVPPDHLGRFRREFEAIARGSGDELVEAARVFVRPRHEGAAALRARAKAARDRLPVVERRLEMATEALRLNPLRRHQLRDLDRYAAAVDLYRRAVIHTATLARIVDDHAAADHPWSHGGLDGPKHLLACAEAVSRALEHKRAFVLSADRARLSRVEAELVLAEAAVRDFLSAANRERGEDTDVRRMIDIAAVAAELAHLVGDIRRHIGERPAAP